MSIQPVCVCVCVLSSLSVSLWLPAARMRKGVKERGKQEDEESDKMPLQRRSRRRRQHFNSSSSSAGGGGGGGSGGCCDASPPSPLVSPAPPPPLPPFPSSCLGAKDTTDPWEVGKSHAGFGMLGAKVFPLFFVQFSVMKVLRRKRSPGDEDDDDNVLSAPV
ncbi:Hypothetical predicted protein [Xyrichtys novacula]|uniref:Uncharacterized protein n=1 Tax=Xyrichtys novacula TaxID=13765 RepID=A0AAV1H275_XYRNO|nr:Hypothetical predicted protein [Xyrichtys novacula]